jgi:hypothetical protein
MMAALSHSTFTKSPKREKIPARPVLRDIDLFVSILKAPGQVGNKSVVKLFLNHRFIIRLLLLHRDIGMDKLTRALLEAEKSQVFRYEKVHEIIQELTNQNISISTLPPDKTPVNLLEYKVNKSIIEQYAQLTGGSRK